MMPKKIEGINVVPFIDIILVLLVIILMEATFIKSNAIDLPSSSSQADTAHISQEALTFSITKSGDILFEDQTITLDQIPDQLKGIQPDTAIHIQGDAKSEFEIFVGLLGLLKESGMNNLSIITESDKKQ